jgi:hypothetical protein
LKTIRHHTLNHKFWGRRIDTSADGQILAAQERWGQLLLWVLDDPDAPVETRWIRLFHTGDKIPEDLKLRYVATVQMEGGNKVVHVFEEVN